MTPIHEYLVSGLLPKDLKESRKIRVKAPQYKLIRGSLYRRDAAKVIQDGEKCKEQSAIRKAAENGAITAGNRWSFKHMEIMKHIEKQLTRSQQGWVDDLAQVLWIHRTLPKNSQKETPFSLTYGSEAIIPIAENTVAKDDRGRT
ncbi:reverse transcriptase domain-containing protein [Tanacetum coccineum]